MRGSVSAALVVGALVLAACGAGAGGDGVSLDDGDADRGRELFSANCAVCHGPEGQGVAAGPPLVHEYYVPSHHGDVAFLLAVQRGVQPHHWTFGSMPAIPSLDTADVADIVAYVRQLQREAGLIE